MRMPPLSGRKYPDQRLVVGERTPNYHYMSLYLYYLIGLRRGLGGMLGLECCCVCVAEELVSSVYTKVHKSGFKILPPFKDEVRRRPVLYSSSFFFGRNYQNPILVRNSKQLSSVSNNYVKGLTNTFLLVQKYTKIILFVALNRFVSVLPTSPHVEMIRFDYPYPYPYLYPVTEESQL
jgi:hypothetical protein